MELRQNQGRGQIRHLTNTNIFCNTVFLSTKLVPKCNKETPNHLKKYFNWKHDNLILTCWLNCQAPYVKMTGHFNIQCSINHFIDCLFIANLWCTYRIRGLVTRGRCKYRTNFKGPVHISFKNLPKSKTTNLTIAPPPSDNNKTQQQQITILIP